MANIDQYLQQIELASRGEEVRDSIIDALEAINTEGPGTMDWSNIMDTPDTLAGYGVSEVPASMVSGVLALNNIPPAAVERVVPVADDAARFALTTDTVQNGDTVKVMDTLKLYLVVDDTHLDTETGYEEYKAGTADSVDWSGILNTPDSLAGYGIEDAYTKDEVDDIVEVDDAVSEAANPLVLSTDSAQYAKSTVVSIEPIQSGSGDPSPSNVRPISGLDEVEVKRTGKNLIPMMLNDIKASNTGGTWSGNAYTYRGITATVNTDGDKVESISLSGTTNATFTFYLSSATANNTSFLPLFKDKAYTISGGATNIRVMTWLYDASRAFVTNVNSTGTDVSIPANTYDYYTPLIEISNGVTVNTTIYPMLRLASDTDDTYEPYTESIVTADLPTTIYGGTLDLESGVLTVDMGIVDLGTLNWVKIADNKFTTALTNCKRYADRPINTILSIYSYHETNWQSISNKEYSLGENITGGGAGVSICDTTYTDAATFKAAMSGVQLCYELATPQTYHLTPHQLSLLAGTNVIMVNGKTVKVTYREGTLATLADVAQPIETAKKELLADIKPILGNIAAEETSPAASGHAVGSYLIYKGNLYKVIAAILVGEPLVVGTNVSRTTVMDELIALTSQ